MSVSDDYDLMDTPPEDDFERLTELAQMVTGAPVSLFSIVGEDRQYFKSQRGLGDPWARLRGTPISHSFCRHVVERGEMLAVNDACADPVLRDNPAIVDLGVAAYLGEPVRAPSGTAVGAFCVIDSTPRMWSERDRKIVRALARNVENAIALRAATRAQAQAMSDLIRINEALSAQSAELAMARLTAEQALSRQTGFLGGLSHELKTPLNGVLGGLALLEAAPDAAVQERCRTMIRASARALTGCVEDLITYCRLGAGIDQPDLSLFDPRRAASSAAESIAALAAEKGLGVVHEIDPATPASWLSDGRRIEQVLVNLLGNAVKYTGSGHVGVSVRPWGDSLAFRVFDTGRGVPEGHRDSIFEPFDRGDAESARSAAGTGLGLAIARETARRLGGSLRLEASKPGKGSVFVLLVPNADASDVAEPVRVPA
jgi:signal transduction histidine kinase